MINVLFSARPALWPVYQPLLESALARHAIAATVSQALPPEEVDYIVYAPQGDPLDFTPYTRTKAVLSLWAGVESIVTNTTLTQPLARMVDVGLTQGMVEWVTGHVLRHHLGMDRHIVNPGHLWNPVAPPLAGDRPVTILGLGALGAACGQALRGLGFPVTGWSRTARDVPGLSCVHGAEGLKAALRTAQIVVLLLPVTEATENVLNAETLALLPQGAVVINPGRGPLIEDDALLAALDSGQISHATLDVFRVEPLPEGHPFWTHPGVTVTPHIASETRPETAAQVIVENIRRGEAGLPLVHLVDRTTGY